MNPTFTMQPQLEDNWCWAAVAVSINNFLDPASETPWTQGTLANKVLHGSGKGEPKVSPAVDCSLTPDACDFTASLADAFTVTGNLSKSLVGNSLAFNSLKDWINSGIPVSAQINWFGGGAHAIVLDGYQQYASGAEVVLVQDPKYGPSVQFYDDLVNDYPPGGVWADTFLVKA